MHRPRHSANWASMAASTAFRRRRCTLKESDPALLLPSETLSAVAKLFLLSPRSVSVRIRPLNEAEAEKGSAWKLESNTIVPVHARGGDPAEGCYVLDNVFAAGWSTEQVYLHTTGDIVAKVVGGFNGARQRASQLPAFQ